MTSVRLVTPVRLGGHNTGTVQRDHDVNNVVLCMSSSKGCHDLSHTLSPEEGNTSEAEDCKLNAGGAGVVVPQPERKIRLMPNVR